MSQNYFILTSDQRTAVVAFNTLNTAIDPRVVDGASPGVSLNLNVNSTGINVGDPVTLTGKYLAPKCIIDDPDYLAYSPDIVAYLADKPFGLCEDDIVFLS